MSSSQIKSQANTEREVSARKATGSSVAATGSRRRMRDVVLSLGLFLLVVLGLVSLALATGWEDAAAQFSRLGSAQIAALLGLSLVNYLLRATRWHLSSRGLGISLPFSHSLRHFLAGFAMSVTPARIGE